VASAPKHIEVIARGVLRRGASVLLCRNIAGGYSYLPGGHVEPGEAAADALRREFEEETGMAIAVGAPLLIAEARFVQDGRPRHEMNLVFHVEHAAGGEPPASVPSREPDIAFDWTTQESLGDVDLRPAFLKGWLVEKELTEGGGLVRWVSVAT